MAMCGKKVRVRAFDCVYVWFKSSLDRLQRYIKFAYQDKRILKALFKWTPLINYGNIFYNIGPFSGKLFVYDLIVILCSKSIFISVASTVKSDHL